MALRNQKGAPHEDLPVCWDYHVVLLLRNISIYPPSDSENCNWVYDFDTRLPVPVPLAGIRRSSNGSHRIPVTDRYKLEYLPQTFSDQFPEKFQRSVVVWRIQLFVHLTRSFISVCSVLYPARYTSSILLRTAPIW